MKRSAKAKKNAREKVGPWELLSMSQGSLNELGRRLVPDVVSPIVHKAAMWRMPRAVMLCRPCLTAGARPEEVLVDVYLRPAPGFEGLRYGVATCERCRRVHVLVAAP